MTTKPVFVVSAPVSVPVRLAFGWVVILFFYIYNDVFMLLADVQKSGPKSGSSPSELIMLAYALVITPAALMPLLCVSMSSAVVRWASIILGLVFFVIILITLLPAGTALFYRFVGVVENLVTFFVVWTAWRWPRSAPLSA